MNRCKNCKYFKRNDGNYYSSKYGECECDKFIYGDSFDSKENKDSKQDELFYIDYEWYKAYVEVGENFGCIHFKKADNKKLEGDK